MANYNIYGDESCHLQNDKQNIMLFGAVWCKEEEIASISKEIKRIKEDNGISKYQELKWSKISESNYKLYKNIVEYFFREDDLMFRSYIILEKDKRNFNDKIEFDVFYYKSYFQLLNNLLSKDNSYKIYLDIKDTRSAYRIDKLKEVLSNANYDFSQKKMIKRIQSIKSYESQLMQITDVLLGAISYINRDLTGNKAKLEIIELIKSYTNLNLKQSTLIGDKKFNLFFNDRIGG